MIWFTLPHKVLLLLKSFSNWTRVDIFQITLLNVQNRMNDIINIVNEENLHLNI